MGTLTDDTSPIGFDFDHLLRANLERVFNERDRGLRAAATAELYAANPTMYEPDAVVEGRDAISDVAGRPNGNRHY